MYQNKIVTLELFNHFPKDGNFEIELTSTCDFENKYKIVKKVARKEDNSDGKKKKKGKKFKSEEEISEENREKEKIKKFSIKSFFVKAT